VLYYKKYKLNAIEKWLEVSLDSHVTKKWRKSEFGSTLPRSFTIKNLQGGESKQYQDAEWKEARKKRINGVEIDIIYWRNIGENT